MQPLINIDELLEQWDEVKTISCPRSSSMVDVIIHECAKNEVDCLAQDVRIRRLENKKSTKSRHIEEFVNAYYAFTKQFVFKILKNDH